MHKYITWLTARMPGLLTRTILGQPLASVAATMDVHEDTIGYWRAHYGIRGTASRSHPQGRTRLFIVEHCVLLTSPASALHVVEQ